jgi:hypothetical protein
MTASPERPVGRPRGIRRIGRCLGRFGRWLVELGQAERAVPLKHREQLAMVVIAHAVAILPGIELIMRSRSIFGEQLHGAPPRGFFTCEVVLIVLCSIPLISAAEITGGARKLVPAFRNLGGFIERRGETFARRTQGGILLFSYLLQFAEFYFLLKATGGPIDSPFAPMLVAIAIFTPVIVNKAWTAWMIVTTTIAYYTVFALLYQFEDCEWRHVSATRSLCEPMRPKPIAFVAVNVLILLLAGVLTFRYERKREQAVSEV